jgi:tetratricopeptide (TPR) repeat protein
MWRIFKFLVLVVLCIPAWIAIQVALEEYAPSGEQSLGAHNAVKAKLNEENWRVVGMDPDEAADAWQLTGLVASPGANGVSSERVFVAKLHTACQRYGDPQCWVVDELAFAAEGDEAQPVAEAGSADVSKGSKAERLKLVQTQLKALGFDPGPLDGAMGQRTRSALNKYLAQKSGDDSSLDAQAADQAATTAAASESVLSELEGMSRQNLGQTHLVKGDYHAAMSEYAILRQLEQEGEQTYFHRGVMYRGMGLPELAIAEYDAALTYAPDNEMVFYQRGSAHYQQRRYWQAYGDYANGLGLRLLGDRYFAVRDRLSLLGDEAASGFETFSHWATVAWVKATGDGQGNALQDEGGRAADNDDENLDLQEEDANA